VSAQDRPGSVQTLVMLLILGAATRILRHPVGLVVALVLLPLAGYAVGRWHGSRRRGTGRLVRVYFEARLRDPLAGVERAGQVIDAARTAWTRVFGQRTEGRP
jgi:hypothetical protein